MRYRACAEAELALLAFAAAIGGCGGSGGGGSGGAAATPPAGEAIAITAPADGRAIKARETGGGSLRARVRARPGARRQRRRAERELPAAAVPGERDRGCRRPLVGGADADDDAGRALRDDRRRQRPARLRADGRDDGRA